MWDRTGWFQVDGSRFHAFFPLGSKILLDNHILFLAEAYGWPPDQVMQMASSRRHRIVKSKTDIEKNPRGGGGETITPDSPTGVQPFPRTGVGSQDVKVGYTSP